MIKHYSLNFLAQFIGRAFSVASHLVLFIIIARHFGPEFLGQYAYFLTFVNVASTLADFGTTITSSKDLASLEGRARELYWGNLLIIRIALSIIVMVISFLAIPLLRSDLYDLLCLGVLTIPFAASRIFDAVFQIFNKPWYSSFSTGLYGLCYVSLSLAILFLLHKPSIIMLGIAYLVAQILYLVTSFKLSFSLLKPVFKIDKEMIYKNLRIALPIGISFIFTIINSRADTFLLAWFKGDKEVGLYNAIYRVVDTSAILAVLMTNPLIPVLARIRNENAETFKKLVRIIALAIVMIGLPFCIIVPFFSEKVILLVYGPSFGETYKAFNILCWVCFLIFLSLFFSNVCLVMEIVYFEWWNAAIAALINVAINYAFIPAYGYLASAWATLVSEIWIVSVTFIFTLLAVKGLLKKRLFFSVFLPLSVFAITIEIFKKLDLSFSLKIGFGLGFYMIFLVGLGCRVFKKLKEGKVF